MVTLHIFDCRLVKRVSLRELESLTGISKSALQTYESGQAYPRIDQLEDIARALNVRLTALFTSDFLPK